MFNRKRNKRFNYKPRFKDSNIVEPKDGFEEKWDVLRENNKRRGNFFTSLPLLIIILASLLMLIYILNRYI